ncbi:DUF6251 family protein [Streptomyces sp. HNM0574]|uniref:DUF6251 family protein n=1 Tax=Streptomyces sp. HNM0574 TaxID=2714954 RepID=UPI001F0D34DA|nr:DUF6251 family protein [Streptomyces sp. HNM0574]
MSDLLPAHQHSATCGCYPTGSAGVYQPVPLTSQPQSPQVVHVHQAPPDRTTQRIALGTGIGAGTVAAGVYFGPLLVGVLTAMAANLAVLALLVAFVVWGGVTVIRTVGGKDGQAAADTLSRARKSR